MLWFAELVFWIVIAALVVVLLPGSPTHNADTKSAETGLDSEDGFLICSKVA